MEKFTGNLEAGGLAMIIAPNSFGKIVTLLAFHSAGSMIRELGGIASTDVWLVSGDGVGYRQQQGVQKEQCFVGNLGIYLPKHLLPIKPEDENINQSQETKLHA